MPRDFPAAHSMDSSWFAVDDDGEVAFFDTGESGALPVGGFALGGEAAEERPFDTAELLATLLHGRAKSDERLKSMLPKTKGELKDALESVDPAGYLPALGVWTYTCQQAFAAPYSRTTRVRSPANVSSLTKALAKSLTRGRLPVRFAAMPAIAPGSYVSVNTWGSVWVDLAGEVHPSAKKEPDAVEVDGIRADLAAGKATQARADEPDSPDGEAYYELVAQLLREAGIGKSVPKPLPPGSFPGSVPMSERPKNAAADPPKRPATPAAAPPAGPLGDPPRLRGAPATPPPMPAEPQTEDKPLTLLERFLRYLFPR